MSTTTQPPDITAHLDAAERAGEALRFALQAALEQVPDDERWSPLRQSLVERIALAARAGDNERARAMLAEASRVKGPMVTITVPPRHGNSGRAYEAEIERITDASIFVRGGERFRLSDGCRHRREVFYGTPYITEEERARILALPRPPAAARPRKEPTK
jgi:hypothetical protein